jgi:hypothetical protein
MSRFEEIILKGEVDDNNSTTTPLGIGGVYTGTSTEIKDCGIVFVSVFTDQASATDGLSIQQSSDGTNWDHTDDYTIAANAGKNYSLNPHSLYFRVVYTNGGAAQSVFRLQSICKTQTAKPSSHRIKDEIVGDDDCTLVKAAITGENGTGQWHNVKTTADGNLTISDNSDGLAIAEGNVTGKTFIHKFGATPDLDTGDGFADVWDGTDSTLGTGKIANYTFSTTADIGLISSSSVSDTEDIEIQGLDSSFAEVTQTVTLTGQTDVDISATGVDMIRVFRMINRGSNDLVGEVYIRTNGTTQTNGVPDTPSSVRAIINNGNNQTLMAIYTIPLGKTAYMRDWYASLSRDKVTTCIIHLDARPDGEVFQRKHVAAIGSTGTSYIQHKYEEPEIFAAKTDIIVSANTTTSDSGVAAGFDIVLIDD